MIPSRYDLPPPLSAPRRNDSSTTFLRAYLEYFAWYMNPIVPWEIKSRGRTREKFDGHRNSWREIRKLFRFRIICFRKYRYPFDSIVDMWKRSASISSICFRKHIWFTLTRNTWATKFHFLSVSLFLYWKIFQLLLYAKYFFGNSLKIFWLSIFSSAPSFITRKCKYMRIFFLIVYSTLIYSIILKLLKKIKKKNIPLSFSL